MQDEKRQGEKRVGDDPNFYFGSALCSFVMFAFMSIWWGWPFVVGGLALAVIYCVRGFWQRRKLGQPK